MCFPTPPQDNSAEIARQQEQARENKIRKGQAAIDTAFQAFTPEYFDKYQQDYLNYYNPQLQDKYDIAKRDLTYNLARQGIQDSTAGFDRSARLADAYNDQRRAVESDAIQATNKARQDVESNKSDLYAQNTASADPSLAAISAAGRAGSLQTPPSYSPIGDVFSGLTNAGASYIYGANQGLPASYARAFQPGATLPNGYRSGSGTVVG